MTSDGADGARAAPSKERLAVVAHELRSPVAALEALAEAAPAVPPADRHRLVELAVAAGRDVERILADPDGGALRLERLDLAALASTFAGDAVVVEAPAAAIVAGDATRLRQVLANLVGNGLRHGANVRVEVGERGGRVVVDVADDGPGVETGVDVFARGVSGAGSSGLGLWIARSIAEEHGGSLELLGGDVPGARFRLCLPAASAVR
jgi:two-component system OmpR family sensor kinase